MTVDEFLASLRERDDIAVVPGSDPVSADAIADALVYHLNADEPVLGSMWLLDARITNTAPSDIGEAVLLVLTRQLIVLVTLDSRTAVGLSVESVHKTKLRAVKTRTSERGGGWLDLFFAGGIFGTISDGPVVKIRVDDWQSDEIAGFTRALSAVR